MSDIQITHHLSFIILPYALTTFKNETDLWNKLLSEKLVKIISVIFKKVKQFA